MSVPNPDTARRLTAKGTATRGRIVDAAAALIFERGVALTTVEDVRSEARVSASQLYHYFTDKRGLVSAVIERQADLVVGAHESLPLDTLQGLADWRDALVEDQRAGRCFGGCPLGSLASELADQDEPHRHDLSAAFDRWQRAFRAGLQAMRDRGELDPTARTDDLSMELLVALQGGLLLAQTRRDPRPLEVALDAAIDHVRRATMADAVGGDR